MPTTTYFGTKVPLSGSFETVKVRRSNSYLFQAPFAHISITKVKSLKMLKLKLHIHIVTTPIISQH